MNYTTKPKRHRILTSILITILCSLCFTSSMMLISTEETLAVTTALVEPSNGVNVRPTAGTDYAPKFALCCNEKVTIINTATGSDGKKWNYISHPYGNGYIRSDFLYNIQNSGGTSGGNTNLPQNMSDAQFEQYMQNQGFPVSYRPYLRKFHKQHPTWIFKAAHTNLDWNYVIAKESKLGVNTVHISSLPAFKSNLPGAKDSHGNYIEFDSGGYIAASRAAIEYYMDPRNSFDSTFFQFLSSKYDGYTQTIAGINNIVRGTFLAQPLNEPPYSSFSSLFMSAGATYGVNPLLLASKLINEHGASGNSSSVLVHKDSKYAKYNGYYNFFNIGAYAHSGRDAIENGLIYAKAHGWSSRTKSIMVGTEWFASCYINNNMSTPYFQKFNVMNGAGAVATGQYMTALWGANSTGETLGKVYKSASASALTFEIPVYVNMPSSAVPYPGQGSTPTPEEDTQAQLAAALRKAKDSAKSELSKYRSASLYRKAQKAELQAAINTGNSQINNANTTEAVRQALAYAKQVIDKIPTDAQLTENEKPSVFRIYGNNRYETSMQTANQLKQILGKDKFDTVVLANSDIPADALSGTYLAYLKQAPILLTSNTVYREIIQYIQQNLVAGGEIILLGGNDVVPSIYEDTFGTTHKLTRLAGNDRYETNIRVLEAIKESGGTNTELIISSGDGYSFADSLSASALRRPIMLTDKALNQEQLSYIEANFKNANMHICGGDDVVSNAVYNGLSSYSNSIERISGNNRFMTSNAIATCFFNSSTDAVYITSGLNFPDGLCAGVVAATQNKPLLLSGPYGLDCNAFVRNAFAGISPNERICMVFGGSDVVADETVYGIMSVRVD